MAPIGPVLRRRVAPARVAYLATTAGAQPGLIPIVFVLLGNHLYHAIDDKPKRVPPEQLRRIRNLQANPRAAVLVDHYEEDWRRLWFTLLEGRVRLLRDGAEHGRALQALGRKYRQYHQMPLAADALVVALDIERTYHWTFTRQGTRKARTG